MTLVFVEPRTSVLRCPRCGRQVEAANAGTQDRRQPRHFTLARAIVTCFCGTSIPVYYRAARGGDHAA